MLIPYKENSNLPSKILILNSIKNSLKNRSVGDNPQIFEHDLKVLIPHYLKRMLSNCITNIYKKT